MSNAESSERRVDSPTEAHASDQIDFAAMADDASQLEARSESSNEWQVLNQQLEDARNRELKAQAEMENFRKRLHRDLENQLKFANLPLVRDLLEVVDNLNRALTITDATPAVQSLLDGVKMVQGQLESVLAKYSCKPIEASGQPFDPNFHQAVTQMPSESVPSGYVAQEVSIGYMMYDRVIRPSMVIVSSGPAGGAE